MFYCASHLKLMDPKMDCGMITEDLFTFDEAVKLEKVLLRLGSAALICRSSLHLCWPLGRNLRLWTAYLLVRLDFRCFFCFHRRCAGMTESLLSNPFSLVSTLIIHDRYVARNITSLIPVHGRWWRVGPIYPCPLGSCRSPLCGCCRNRRIIRAWSPFIRFRWLNRRKNSRDRWMVTIWLPSLKLKGKILSNASQIQSRRSRHWASLQVIYCVSLIQLNGRSWIGCSLPFNFDSYPVLTGIYIDTIFFLALHSSSPPSCLALA